MLFYDSVNRGQTESGASSGFLGGEERFENPGQDLRGNAAARIPDRETTKGARACFGIHKSATSGHGIARIDGEVQQNLFYHADIRVNGAQARRGDELEGNVGAEQTAQHPDHGIDHLVQIELLRLHLLFPAECEQLASQAGGPFGRRANLFDRFLRLFA